MSSASKSKSTDKKAGKETQKASSKPSGIANAVSGVPATVYNPLSGTFHILESGQTASSSPLHTNGRFRNIDETDDHHGFVGAGVEYDSVSNNGSWSGESEDHKEKTEKTSSSSAKQETVPGIDNDKREKIRLKNERKHQRQKEKRAQELHERCCGYLMSRKLEALAQQLVAMGFSHERAMNALILNEGKVEDSVTWLFDAGEEADKAANQNLDWGGKKIDISEELSRITKMEITFKCTKQEVERAVVNCEGDLDKAAESLILLKLDPTSTAPKPDETGDPPTPINGKLPASANQNIIRQQPKSLPPPIPSQRRHEKDFNYVKTSLPVLGSSDTDTKILQPLKRVQQKMEWVKPQQTAVVPEQRWASGSNRSVSYPMQTPLHVNIPAARAESYSTVGGEYKNIQHGTVREPVIVMQRPQSANAKQVTATSISSSPPGSTGWCSANGVGIMKPNSKMPQIPSIKGLGPNISSSGQLFNNLHYQQQHLIPNSNLGDTTSTSRGMSLWHRTGASPTLAAASSLGLFSGLGSNGSSGSSSPVDWSRAGLMSQLDYTNIDWSLDPSRTSPRFNQPWLGSGALSNNVQAYDTSNSSLGSKLPMRPPPNVNGVSIPVLQENGVPNPQKSAAGSREWTSPFEGNDLFSLPRQFVSSPSMSWEEQRYYHQ